MKTVELFDQILEYMEHGRVVERREFKCNWMGLRDMLPPSRRARAIELIKAEQHTHYGHDNTPYYYKEDQRICEERAFSHVKANLIADVAVENINGIYINGERVVSNVNPFGFIHKLSLIDETRRKPTDADDQAT